MSTDTHLSTVALKLSSWAAALAMIAGVMVLVGWTFEIAVLKSILPGWVSMKANTATCFILSGIALWLVTRQQRSALFSRFALFCTLLVGLIGLLTLGEYIFGWNLGIDQWLFQEPVGTVGTPHPGRMTAETALLFVLLAAALWITVGSSQKLWIVLTSKVLGIVVTTLAVGEILSYATPGLGPYVWFGFPIMSMHAATLFAVLGMSVIAVNWQRGLPWSLGGGTTVAFVCGMAMLVFVGLSINRSQFWQDEADRKIMSSEEVLNDIVKIQVELTEAQAHTRGYAITRDKGFLGAYLGDISVYQLRMDALRQRIAGNQEQQQQLSLIETNVKLLQRWTQQFIDAPQTGTIRRKMDARGDEFLDSIHDTFDQIEDEHLRLIRKLKQKSESVARFSYLAITTGTLASLLIFMMVIFRLNSAVSERKQIEGTLRASEEKFSRIFESNPAMVAIGTLDGTMVDVNLSYANFLGFHRKEMLGKSLADLGIISAEELRRLLELGQRVGESLRNVEVTLRARSGKLLNALLSAEIVTLDGIHYRLATLQDITARKQVEEELKTSKQRLDLALESGRMGAWDIDLIHDTSWRSPQHDQIFGHESLLQEWGQAVFMQHVVPEERDRVSQCFEEALRTDRLDFECKITQPDQSQRWIFVRGQVYRDEMALPVRMVGTIMDITERKRLELDKEQYLKFFMLSINPMCIADPYGCFTRVNPAFVKLTGYSESELLAKPFLNFVLPEDRQRTEDEMKLQVEKRQTLYFDNRYLCKDGSVIDLSWTAYYDKHDGISYATAIDTTERKQTEAKIAEQLEELRRWHDVTSGREERILDLKHEVNELLAQTGQPPRYPSAESQIQTET